jgi:hypothetical protein
MPKGGVPIGWTSITGWGATLVAILPLIVQDLEAGSVAFHSQQKWLAVFGVVAFSITQVFRYLQALKTPPARQQAPETGQSRAAAKR